MDHESGLCTNKELYSGNMPGLVMSQCLILLLLFLGGLLSDTQEAQRPLPGRGLGGSRLVIQGKVLRIWCYYGYSRRQEGQNLIVLRVPQGCS